MKIKQKDNMKMIPFKELQNKADECLNTAKIDFIKEGDTAPLLFGVTEEGTLISYNIDISNQGNKNKIPVILNEMAWAYSAVILIVEEKINTINGNGTDQGYMDSVRQEIDYLLK
jgi:hypothetical protein